MVKLYGFYLSIAYIAHWRHPYIESLPSLDNQALKNSMLNGIHTDNTILTLAILNLIEATRMTKRLHYMRNEVSAMRPLKLSLTHGGTVRVERPARSVHGCCLDHFCPCWHQTGIETILLLCKGTILSTTGNGKRSPKRM